MNEVLLKLEKLEVTYQRVIIGVQGVSLEVPRGALIVILGTVMLGAVVLTPIRHRR